MVELLAVIVILGIILAIGFRQLGM
ncbi:prepilin-type N-terminal cleavage/methylation domain-containing protein [Oceanobacillus rekensis]|nr:prepilin-type N-terminal cleavage/methylation domain-containing protein [Oceanobacillus rekensis]